MKEALFKKRYGIPAALLLALLLVPAFSGTAFAWYSFTTKSSETNVQEPISTANEVEFSALMSPGEENTWSFNIMNSDEDKGYLIRADLTYSAPDGVSITSFTVTSVNSGETSDETNDLLSDGIATFKIHPDETLSCEMRINAANDAGSGEVSVSLELSRA